jgi:hypothetical protein
MESHQCHNAKMQLILFIKSQKLHYLKDKNVKYNYREYIFVCLLTKSRNVRDAKITELTVAHGHVLQLLFAGKDPLN